MAISSTTRYTGLASGLDTDDIVSKLIKASSVPLNTLKQQKQIVEWKRDEYRTLNMKFFDFRSASVDMRLSSNYLAKSASSSNTNVVSATGTAAANVGQHKIKIDQLAQSASVRTDQLAAPQGLATKINDLGISGLNLTSETSITIGGSKGSQTFKLGTDASIANLVANINSATSSTGVSVTFDTNMNRLFLSDSGSGSQSNIRLDENLSKLFASTDHVYQTFTTGEAENLKISDTIGSDGFFSIEGTKFKVTKDMTVSQLVKQINENKNSNSAFDVAAVFSSDGQISLVRSDSTPLTIEAFGTDGTTNSTDILTKLGFSGTTNSSVGIVGQDAKVTFDGIEQYYNTNNFQIAGINFTARQESTEEVSIGVAQDVDTVVDKIKSFVDKYNELISTVNSKLSEARYRTFTPLTDDQREEMTEDQIANWESKAKSGLLRSDSILNGAMVSMRNALANSVTGLSSSSIKSLTDIGISSSVLSGGVVTGDYSEKGKLYIDEDKLRTAIMNNPEEIQKLFTVDDGDPETTAGDGILTRLVASMDSVYGLIRDKAGLVAMDEDNYSMGKELNRMDKRLEAMTSRLEDLETRYYKQFTALETYLNKMNTQSAWLTQQFSS